VATSIGFSADAEGDLYEIFSDGTRKLKEAGYNTRVLGSNWKTPITGPSSTTPTETKSVSPTPPAVTSVVVTKSSDVKTSEISAILFDDESVSISVMESLVFEDIGGHELLNIARRDTINGQKVIYQPIKNLTELEQQYNSNNLLRFQGTSDKYFANFPIKLEAKIPIIGSGPNEEYVYISRTTGDLIIDSVNLEPDEQIEIQIAASGTIYEAEI
jgi:hypothetical protein